MISKSRLRDVLWVLFNRLENNNNINPDTNGERLLMNELSSKQDKITIFDVGANIGNYTKEVLDALKEKAVIHAFEPNASGFESFRIRYKDNEQVIPNNFALSDKEEILTLFYDKEKSTLSSLYKRNLEHINIRFDKSEQIKCIRFDNYIQTTNITHLDLLKLDVEGHELHVLEGMGDYLNADFVDYIQFEYGGANIDSRSYLLNFYELLLPKNFSIYKIMPNKLERRDYKACMENFQYSNYIAISNKLKR